MGTTLVPEMALDQLHLQNQNAVAVPLAEDGPHRRIAFVTRLNYARVDDVSLLGDVFNKAFKDAVANDED